MKVAFVMPGVGVVRRGAEAFVVELATALAAASPPFEVHLFCRGDVPGVPFAVHRIAAVSRDARLPNAIHGWNRWLRKAFDTVFLDPLSLEWYSAALAAFPALWQGDFDAVVMEGGIVGAWLCRLLRLARGVPFVDIAHGLDPKWEGAFARQHPDAVVTFTRAAARMLEERAPGERIVVIPHGVDLALFRPDVPPVELPLARPVVLAAGAVDAHKRMDRAVHAAARANVSLALLGDGPEAARVDALADRLLGPKRYLRATVPRSAMPAWHTAADLFTLPSKSESFGLAYLEALACNRPVVAPDDAARREVIGDAGLYCDVENATAYADALRAALDSAWDGRPRRRAEGFPVEATVAAYAGLLRGLR